MSKMSITGENEGTMEQYETTHASYRLVREIGAASTVLLKNVDKTLPLCKPRSITLFGTLLCNCLPLPSSRNLVSTIQGLMRVHHVEGNPNSGTVQEMTEF